MDNGRGPKGNWLRTACFTSIPNPIDVTAFKRMEKRVARKRFDLPKVSSFFFFAPLSFQIPGKSDFFDRGLRKTEREIPRSHRNRVDGGNSSEELISQFPFKVNTLGYIGSRLYDFRLCLCRYVRYSFVGGQLPIRLWSRWHAVRLVWDLRQEGFRR